MHGTSTYIHPHLNCNLARYAELRAAVQMFHKHSQSGRLATPVIKILLRTDVGSKTVLVNCARRLQRVVCVSSHRLRPACQRGHHLWRQAKRFEQSPVLVLKDPSVDTCRKVRVAVHHAKKLVHCFPCTRGKNTLLHQIPQQ